MKRKLFALLLAALLALGTALCFAGCGGGNGSASTPSAPSTPSSPSSPSLPSTPSDTDPDDKTEKYSQILQDVLNSGYYNSVIDAYQEHINGRYDLSNIERPIPYTFLENHGHNVSAIKSDKLKCDCVAYVKENDKSRLYLSVKAENEYAGGNYYTDYILSYPLTEKEYDDLYMLHSKKYIQAPLFIQEFDKQKTAKIESCVNVEVETFEGLIVSINKLKGVEDVFPYDVTLDVINVDAENLGATFYLRSLKSKKITDMMNKTELRELGLIFKRGSHFTYNIYLKIINTNYSDSYVNIDEFQENYTPIICFDSQNIYNVNNDLTK